MPFLAFELLHPPDKPAGGGDGEQRDARIVSPRRLHFASTSARLRAIVPATLTARQGRKCHADISPLRDRSNLLPLRRPRPTSFRRSHHDNWERPGKYRSRSL